MTTQPITSTPATSATKTQTSASNVQSAGGSVQAPALVAPTGSNSQATAVLTPMGTIEVSLKSPQPGPFLQNPANILPLVAFAGVVLTIWFGWKKMKIELASVAAQVKDERDHSRAESQRDRDHDAAQAQVERLTKARREVYLELVSEMQKAQNSLSMLPLRSFDKIDPHAGFSGLITATSKVALLGEMKTVRISREVLASIHAALLRVNGLQMPLKELKERIEHHAEMKKKHAAEADRLANIVNANARNFVYSSESAHNNTDYNFNVEKANQHEREGQELAIKLDEESMAYTLAVLTETTELARKFDELVVSIRTELGLETDVKELADTSTAMQKAAETALKRMTANMPSE